MEFCDKKWLLNWKNEKSWAKIEILEIKNSYYGVKNKFLDEIF